MVAARVRFPLPVPSRDGDKPAQEPGGGATAPLGTCPVPKPLCSQPPVRVALVRGVCVCAVQLSSQML